MDILIHIKMTPQEKAERLIFKMKASLFSDGLYDAKRCALVAVDELINSTQYEAHLETAYNPHETTEYWLEVKEIIDAMS